MHISVNPEPNVQLKKIHTMLEIVSRLWKFDYTTTEAGKSSETERFNTIYLEGDR